MCVKESARVCVREGGVSYDGKVMPGECFIIIII